MRKILMSKYIYCLLFLFTALFSCKDENEFPVDKSYERMFRPHTLVAEDITATSVKLTWPIVTGTSSYILEMAKGNTFDQIVKTYEFKADELNHPTDATDLEFTVSDLVGVTDYSARIKVTSKAGIPDSEYSMVSFSTPAEQIMLPVTELEYTSAMINWKPGVEVTHLNVTASGGQAQKVEITADEKTAGQKSLPALNQGTTYTVEIYNTDSNKRGNITFTTPSLNLPAADQVIFLKKTDVFSQATIDTLTKSPVIVFPAGGVYSNNSALVLKNGLSITFYGEPLSPMPILAWNGVTLPATAGTIRFENLDITGLQYDNGVETTTKRSYIFNQSVASQTEAVIFENCKIRNFANTPFRIQSSNPIAVGRLVFNKCIAFDCGVNASGNGSYSFIHNSVATGKINTIEITNSTLYNIGYSLILHNLSGSESVKIEKCTFNDFVGDGRYTIDYNNQVVGTFSLANCILGKTKSPANTASGIRIAGAAVTAINSYKTSDFIATAQATKVIGGLIEYTKASTDLFIAPTDGDFNFKDQNFEGKDLAGDPRWK
jgi:hypothetical protein